MDEWIGSKVGRWDLSPDDDSFSYTFGYRLYNIESFPRRIVYLYLVVFLADDGILYMFLLCLPNTIQINCFYYHSRIFFLPSFVVQPNQFLINMSTSRRRKKSSMFILPCHRVCTTIKRERRTASPLFSIQHFKSIGESTCIRREHLIYHGKND